jgi:RNA polymerase subunit RPABC4/transcription elongation factor Spt4
MDKKDPFDELLMHCLDDGKTRVYDSKAAEGKTTGNLVNCSYCNEVINVNYRYCPNCGAATVEKSSESTNGFVSIIQQKKAFKVALLDIDRDFNLNGEYFTKLRIRIENLTEERLHLSLVCVDSVIINAAGRQFGPVDSEDIDIPEMFESWFYLYPHAYREGVMVFPEIPERIKNIYICCNPQNTEEEELFMFAVEQ